jgi:putative addiction module CopG family antidote
MISELLPPELGEFVEQQIATGRYESEKELVTDAVRVLRELDTHHEQFSEDVRLGMEQLAAGDFEDYDHNELRDLFDGLMERARKRSEGKGETQ